MNEIKVGDWVLIDTYPSKTLEQVSKVTNKQFVVNGIYFWKETGQSVGTSSFGAYSKAQIAEKETVNRILENRQKRDLALKIFKYLQETKGKYLTLETLKNWVDLINPDGTEQQ